MTRASPGISESSKLLPVEEFFFNRFGFARIQVRGRLSFLDREPARSQ